MVREKSNFSVADAQIYLGHKKIFVDKCNDIHFLLLLSCGMIDQ